MAYVRVLKSGLIQAQVWKHGIRDSETFTLKSKARAWAAKREAEIEAGVRGEIPDKTVGELLTRYKEEVTPDKKGARWEGIRLELLGRSTLASVKLRHLDTHHVAAWQEGRLKEVSGASVRRERNLLNAAFEIARKEWRWLKQNPFLGVRRPKDGKARVRIAKPEEIEKVLAIASPEMRRAIVVAIETGMRASEIASRPEIRGRVAVLVDSKNGSGREIPLSQRALEVLEPGPISISAGVISTLWARYCKAAKIEDLHLHDLRRTAITNLARKLDPFELAKMVGHRDLRQTLNVYYKSDTEKVAEKLG